MKINTSILATLVLSMMAFVIIGGNPSDVVAGSTMVFGEPQPLGEGTVRSCVTIDDQGKPTSLGISFTKAVLSGLPSGELPTEVKLALPEQVAVPPFDHISFDWQAHHRQALQMTSRTGTASARQ